MPLYIFLLLGLSSIIQFVLGANFYCGAFKSLQAGNANMDVLVVLGTSAAWFYGLLLIFIGDYAGDVKPGESEDVHVQHMVH